MYHFEEQSSDPIEPMKTEKKKYIEDYLNNERVFLDYDAIIKNPGRRQVAKLALNAFWGQLDFFKIFFNILSIYFIRKIYFLPFVIQFLKK